MYIMDNPECTLLSVVKVEDELKEVKQEPNSNAESEFVRVEDSLSETRSENGRGDAEDSMDALVTLSEDEVTQCDRPLIKVDICQRRRLRFSEADDMILLRRVAALNPYKCNVLWKEVTGVVAAKAGKNFTVRSIRDHTDLLMNTLSLRGIDACLKRTPPDLWEKKKRLLQLVQNMWKREPFTRSSTSDRTSNSSSRSRRNSGLDEQPETQKQTVGAETPKLSLTPSSSVSALPAVSSLSKTPSVPLLMQHQNAPVGLHFRASLQSMTCPPLLANPFPPSMQQLAINPQLELQNLGVATSFPLPALGRPKQRMLLPSPPVGSSSDRVTESVSSDLPLSLISNSLSDSSKVALALPMVHNSMTWAPPKSTESISVTLCNSRSPSPSIASVDSEAPLMSVELEKSEQSVGTRLANRRQRITSVVRARLNFLQKRHADQFVLKRRELELEKRRIVLEEKKLSLEERKLKLEEEKWLFDRKEREEKLLMMVEERENKMSVERRQQNMIDILLELKKKE